LLDNATAPGRETDAHLPAARPNVDRTASPGSAGKSDVERARIAET
jgi:hypothetical protein